MRENIFDLLKKNHDIGKNTLDLIKEAENELKDIFAAYDEICEYNQYKVINALQETKISDVHFNWTTGYGYDDQGREALENVYKEIFKTEDALVRPIIVSGTHALTLCLTGILRPGDELIYATGKPYDTLEEVIGIRGHNKGSLKEFNVSYNQIELKPNGRIDIDAVLNAISEKTKMIAIQRATGYSWRPAITIEEIEEFAKAIKNVHPDIILMADNCYGEFLDTKEPTEVGIDVLAGSLIKNPGGGLALTGGYIAGSKEIIEIISYRMTSQGIGKECGLMFGQTRSMLMGLFLAPKTVNAALKGAILCAKVFSKLGYDVCPEPDEKRSDIIQCVKLESPEKVIAFCEGIQAASPVDSFVTPIPWEMPGYSDEVIMAAGAFIQGSSIELSADAPMREPYIVYFQGGLTYEYSKLGVILALERVARV